MQLQVKENYHGMGQDLPNETMLIVPQVMHSNAGHPKALGQVRAHGFDPFAPLRRGPPQRPRVGWGGHARPGRGEDHNVVAGGQEGSGANRTRPC